jgi:hypothetical protein
MDNSRAPVAPLDRAARASLPLARLLRLYLDPFALFADASTGPIAAREEALAFNRTMRRMLIVYLRRWSAIGAMFYLAIIPFDLLGGERTSMAIPAAAFALAFCMAVSVIAYTLVAYVFLRAPGRKPAVRPTVPAFNRRKELSKCE